MTQFAPILRVAVAVSLAAALASACGGQSFTSGSDGDAGSSNGGSSSTAGSHATAGKPHGGSSSTAGTGQGGGSGGSNTAGMGTAGNAAAGSGGSDPGDACSGPSTLGDVSCSAAFMYWTHDAKTGLCMPILYGGCGGTKNLYKTLAECQTACPGGMPNFDACTVATDCTLIGGGCCGVCDSPNVSAHDFISVNKQMADKVMPCGGGVACGACPPSDAQGTLKYFVPNCVQGQCVVEDLRTSAVTACKTPQDCRVRSGNGCCPSCNLGQDIAVRTDGSFEKLVCGNVLPPCAACLPQSDAVAVCGADQHCQVEYPVAGGTP
jgi:hypothetical protein